MVLPGSLAPIGGITTNGGLNLIKVRNALQGFFGDAGALCSVNIKELAPDMRQAGNLFDTSRVIEFLKTNGRDS